MSAARETRAGKRVWDDRMRFRVIEYLVGTGPEEVEVSAGQCTAPLCDPPDIPAKALYTTWDGRETILFLARDGEVLRFADTTRFDYGPEGHNRYRGTRAPGYTIDSANPVWLPLEPGSESSFVTEDLSPADELYPKISLDELRSRIDWLEEDAEVEGHEDCLGRRLGRLRAERNSDEFFGPDEPYSEEVRLPAGSAVGTYVRIEWISDGNGGSDRHSKGWLSGEDAGLFRVEIADADGDPRTGYSNLITTAVRLESGTYRFLYEVIPDSLLPCNFRGWTFRMAFVVEVGSAPE